jgi:hypothetical protein
MLDDIVNMLDAPWISDAEPGVKAALEEVRDVVIDTGDLLSLWQDDCEPSE